MPTDQPAAHVTAALRVLIVENHPDTMRVLRMYLESMGHTVRSADTLKNALAAAADASYDVLLSDIGLPDGTGWELMHALKERGQTPAFAVAMSGFGMNADHLRSQDAGFRRHLLKPFKQNDLDAVLTEASTELCAQGGHTLKPV